MSTEAYGSELILDIHDCDPATFNRDRIGRFCAELCDLIGMEACDLHFWDDVDVPEADQQTDPKTKGTTAIQFLIKSNITIHTLDLLGKVFVNLFSCESFDGDAVAVFAESWFRGHITHAEVVDRL